MGVLRTPYPVHCSAALRAHSRDHPRVTLRAQMGLRARDEDRRTNRDGGVRLPAVSIKARSAGTYPTFRRARGPFPLHSSALTLPASRGAVFVSIWSPDPSPTDPRRSVM